MMSSVSSFMTPESENPSNAQLPRFAFWILFSKKSLPNSRRPAIRSRQQIGAEFLQPILHDIDVDFYQGISQTRTAFIPSMPVIVSWNFSR
jgi:hypothetical protein